MEKQAHQNELSGYLNSKNTKGNSKDRSVANKKQGGLVRSAWERIKKWFAANKKFGLYIFSCIISIYIVFAFVVLPMYIEYENEQLRRFVKDNGITQSKLMQYEKRMQAAAQSQPNVSMRRY